LPAVELAAPPPPLLAPPTVAPAVAFVAPPPAVLGAPPLLAPAPPVAGSDERPDELLEHASNETTAPSTSNEPSFLRMTAPSRAHLARAALVSAATQGR